jgi:hypothetical protein
MVVLQDYGRCIHRNPEQWIDHTRHIIEFAGSASYTLGGICHLKSWYGRDSFGTLGRRMLFTLPLSRIRPQTTSVLKRLFLGYGRGDYFLTGKNGELYRFIQCKIANVGWVKIKRKLSQSGKVR